MNPRSNQTQKQNRKSSLCLFVVLMAVTLGVVSRATEPEIDWDKVSLKGLTAKNVFGPDDRKAIFGQGYPGRTIGKVVTASGGGCTGTLVGPSLVLTAAHCVLDEDGEIQPVTFYPNQIAGKSLTSAKAKRIIAGTNDSSQTNRDWAIVILEKRLGEVYGMMLVTDTTTEVFPQNLIVVGYSGNFMNGETASSAVGTHRGSEDGYVFHDADAGRGSSGGPVVTVINGKMVLVGINVAERRQGRDETLYRESYDEDHANIAIPTKLFMPVLRLLIQQGL